MWRLDGMRGSLLAEQDYDEIVQQGSDVTSGTRCSSGRGQPLPSIGVAIEPVADEADEHRVSGSSSTRLTE
jgi:hypothetical protein